MENNAHFNDKQYMKCLAKFILQAYGIPVISVAPAKRGHYGETWRIDTQDNSYFVKIVSFSNHKPIYKRSFTVIEYLTDQGIDFISRIVKTLQSELFTIYQGSVLGVFEWINGENANNVESKLRQYEMLSKIYSVSIKGFDIPYEKFLADKLELFYRQWDIIRGGAQDETTAFILRLFEENSTRFEERANRLLHFSKRCKHDSTNYYITHGDAGNVMQNGDKFFIVDWDDPVYAPPERDAWFRLHSDWAISGFNEALKRNNIQYSLRPERLAYYCYNSFFGYMTVYLQTYLEVGDINGNLTTELVNYMDCWIEDRIKFADTYII